MVRLYRTFSSYILAGETRCAGCFCKAVDREGSVQSNHPELRGQTSPHLASFVMLWFERFDEVRCA